jgi:hypothetical protein
VVERQPVDCYALEQHSLYPLGNTLCASDGSRRALACCRLFEDDGDLSKKEKASVFKKFLVLFGEWIDWANRLLPSLGLKCFGLKRKVSCPAMGRMFKRAKAVFSRAQIQVGSKCLASKASSKLVDPAPRSVGDLGFVSSTLVGEGVPCFSGLSAVLPMALSSSSLAGGGFASGLTVVSSAPGLDLIVYAVPACFDLVVGESIPVASASIRPAGGGQPPLLFVSEANPELLELGVVWKFAGASQLAQFPLPELVPLRLSWEWSSVPRCFR